MLVVFVAPFFSENAKLFLAAAAAAPDVSLAVVGQDDVAVLAPELRQRLTWYERVGDALSTDAIVGAVERVAAARGPVHRLLGVVEQLQVPLAEARERLGVEGMRPEKALNFRDKTRMKDLLRAAGLPVARHRLVETSEAAKLFAAEVGYPIIVKPPAGAASQTTYRADDEAALVAALGPTSQAAGGVVLLEEFVTGQEHSFDAFVQGGRVISYSVSDYHPTPLEVMQHPWMQWVVVLPRDYEAADIAEAGERTLQVLGLEEGMCHLEWFRRADGSVVISEVGARPPGAQIPTMIARAHDVDCLGTWVRLVTTGDMVPLPPRQFAVGAAYLRGQGQGRVRGVHGLDVVERDVGHLVTDARIPQVGQPQGASYEGEGFVILRHPETKVVEDALRHVISNVRVELG